MPTPVGHYLKRWNEDFEKDQNFKDDTRWVEEIESVRPEDYQDIARVMRETLNTEQSYPLGIVEAYCYGARIQDVRDGIEAEGQRRAAWLDDRMFGIPDSGGRGSRPAHWLSASELLKELDEKVCCRHGKFSI